MTVLGNPELAGPNSKGKAVLISWQTSLLVLKRTSACHCSSWGLPKIELTAIVSPRPKEIIICFLKTIQIRKLKFL